MEARTPMQRDTIFGLASMTKPVTAVATMILVEEGKLRLDEPVDHWLPDRCAALGVPTRRTFLVQHRVRCRWCAHRASLGHGAGSVPGDKDLRPLGMTDTGFWVAPSKRARVATYYRAGQGRLAPVPNKDTRYTEAPVFPAGAAGLVSTVDDYLVFARMLLNEGEADGVRILSRTSVELMTTDQLSEDPAKRFFVGPGFWRGSWFGLGLMLTTERLDLGPSVGAFWWNGATGVTWSADPHEDLIFVNFIQRNGTPSGYSADYVEAVYQAIVD